MDRKKGNGKKPVNAEAGAGGKTGRAQAGEDSSNKQGARHEFCARAFESAKDGFFICDKEGRYHAVNPAGCAMFGYSPEDILSSGIRLLLFPEDVEESFGLMRRCWTDGAHIHRYRMRRKDGSEIWVAITINTFTIGDKEYCLCVKRDVTEDRAIRLELERAREGLEERVRERTAEIQKTNDMLREAQAIAHIGSWERDLATGEISWTDEVYRIFGLKPGESVITFDKLLERVHPDDRERLKRTVGEAIERRKDYSIEYRIVRPDRTVRFVNVHARLAIDRDGRPVRLVGTVQDITGRKLVEDEIEKSGERLNEAQRVAHVGSWEWDIARNTLYWTDEIYRIFGLKPREFGATYEAFLNSVHPDDRESVKKSVNDALYPGGRYSIEHRIVLPGGEVRTVHEEAEVTFGADGKAVRMIGTVHDVTERKKLEEEAVKARKLESLGTLAGGLAHDFNNLLVGVLGNVSLAKMELKPGDRAFALLSEVEKASLRAKALTRQLLTFSKGGEPVKERADVCELLKMSADLALKDSGVSFECACPKDRFYADVDVGQILHALNNIILNAREASARGALIKAATEAVPAAEKDALPLDSGDYIRVSIKDAGKGIPGDALPKVFDPFFTTKERASGLGLTVAYSIVKRHGGHITVESEPGRGTAFHIYLPQGFTAPAGTKAPAEEPVRGRGRVLVMDDEDFVREVAGEILKTLGYEPSFAKDGETALDMYRRSMDEGRHYDLVIMDLTIPGGMGGKDAVKKLLALDPGARAIVSSGYSADPIMSDFRTHGFMAVITKPYMVVEFSRVVKDVISGKA